MLIPTINKLSSVINRSNKLFSTHSQAVTKLKMGLPLKEILTKLENFAPLSLAESWDNVGLLVDPMSALDKKVETILLTNDLTEDVVNEAVENKTGLVVSYHPNIFQGLKSVSDRTWKERLVVRCIRNEIAVFSPHTSWDCVNGGVNDWLASAFSHRTVAPIKGLPENPQQGAGRVLTLKEPISVRVAIENVKKLIGIDHLRLALARGKTPDSQISSVALCAGSGNSVLSGVAADLYLTGEMLHHDILDATQKGINVILCNHSDSERGFLRKFQTTLQDTMLGGAVKVLVSKSDRDPLVTV